jgi:tRNA dimethylallyltransferase
LTSCIAASAAAERVVSAARGIAIVGATATGKTAIAEALARRLGGEIVCADSRQIFRELDVGTGKPSAAERTAQPHHLFEALSLADAGAPRASAGWYAGRAREACREIHARGKAAILVGGSGLYVRAALAGLAPTPEVDAAVRSRLRAEMNERGAPALHARLASIDPETAARLATNDAQRIARAIEVYESSGRTLSWWHARPKASALPGSWNVVELTASAAAIARRIEARTLWMYENGLIEETRALIDRGLGARLERLHAIGYDEAAALAAGAVSRREAVARTSLRTLQLAKRQRTWFRHQIEAVRLDTESSNVATLSAAIEALPASPV